MNKKMYLLPIFALVVISVSYYIYSKRHLSEVPVRKNVITEAENQKLKASIVNSSKNLSTNLAAKTLKANGIEQLTTFLLKPKNDIDREQFIGQALHYIPVIEEADMQLINQSTWQHLFNLILPMVEVPTKQTSPYRPKTRVLAARLISQIPLSAKNNKDEIILKMAQNPKQDNDIRFIIVEGLLKKEPTPKNAVTYFKQIIRMPRPMDSATLAQILTQMRNQQEKEKILIDFLDYFPKVPENSRLYWLSNYTGIKTTLQQDRRILNAFGKVTSDMTREALIEFIKIKEIKTEQSKKILAAIKAETKNPALRQNAEILIAR